jgi:hypothetical protein
VIDTTAVEPRVLRWGAIAQSELARYLGPFEKSA